MNPTPTPTPSPEQALRVLEILGEWTAQGFTYSPFTNLIGHTQDGPQLGTTQIKFTNPEDSTDLLFATGVNHFDALCQATTVMQILLEEHSPEKDP